MRLRWPGAAVFRTPFGYSLSTLAVDTAVYNSGVVAGNPATPPIPNLTIYTLAVGAGNATVQPNTDLYVPIFIDGNSPPADPNFPASIANQAVDAAFFDVALSSAFGITQLFVQANGQTTLLDDSYIVGVNTAPLLDASPSNLPGGTEYIVSAAVLTPLTPGTYTIGEGGVIGGVDTVFESATVTVVPEPSAVGLLILAAESTLRRKRRIQK